MFSNSFIQQFITLKLDNISRNLNGYELTGLAGEQTSKLKSNYNVRNGAGRGRPGDGIYLIL